MSAAPHGPLRNYTVLSNSAWVGIKTLQRHSQPCSTYIKHQMETQTTTMKATPGHKEACQWMSKTSECTAGCGGLSCCEEHREDGELQRGGGMSILGGAEGRRWVWANQLNDGTINERCALE